MKKIISIVIFLSIFCFTFGNINAAIQKTDKEPVKECNPKEIKIDPLGPAEEKKALKEYTAIFVSFLTAEKTEGWSRYVERVAIKNYKLFLRKHPKCSFAPEAKLRIAEFYDLIFHPIRSKLWLDDIIENHASDAYWEISAMPVKTKDGVMYNVTIKKTLATKTAAWALYWRALWFPENRAADLERLLRDYSESKKPVELGKRLLQKLKKEKDDK